jgi:hypothetical protein
MALHATFGSYLKGPGRTVAVQKSIGTKVRRNGPTKDRSIFFFELVLDDS